MSWSKGRPRLPASALRDICLLYRKNPCHLTPLVTALITAFIIARMTALVIASVIAPVNVLVIALIPALSITPSPIFFLDLSLY